MNLTFEVYHLFYIGKYYIYLIEIRQRTNFRSNIENSNETKCFSWDNSIDYKLLICA